MQGIVKDFSTCNPADLSNISWGLSAQLLELGPHSKEADEDSPVRVLVPPAASSIHRAGTQQREWQKMLGPDMGELGNNAGAAAAKSLESSTGM
jgi:hypothetical protein